MFRKELREPQGDLIAAQKSADGIVGQAAGKAREALQCRKAEQQIGQAEAMTEGLNDGERQVGLVSHGGKAVENTRPVMASDLGIGRSG